MMNPDLSQMSEEEAFRAGLADGGDVPETQTEPPAAAPEATPPAEQAPADEGQTTPIEGLDTTENAAQPSAEDEWLAALPEDIRNRYIETQSANRKLQEELAQARNDHASMAGKLRPLQQKLASYERAPPAAPAAPAALEQAPQTVEELDAQLATPEFAEWEKTFPEEAKVWKANNRRVLEAAEKIAKRQVDAAVQTLSTRFEPIIGKVEKQQKIEDYNARISQLESVHPDWKQYNEGDDFSNWFDEVYLPQQPDFVQERFADPKVVARYLSDPEFTAKRLTEFKRDRGITNAQPATTPTVPDPKPTTPPARLALSVAPSVGSTPPISRVRLDLMTPEQAFLAGLKSPD